MCAFPQIALSCKNKMEFIKLRILLKFFVIIIIIDRFIAKNKMKTILQHTIHWKILIISI